MIVDKESVSMNNLTWKYVKALKNEKAVDDFLIQQNASLENGLIDLIKNNNGGRPTLDTFDTNMSKERVFKALLSYNPDDKETIYKCYSNELKEKLLFPFATDPAGNYICVDFSENNSIVFFELESLKKEFIADNLLTFINKLY